METWEHGEAPCSSISRMTVVKMAILLQQCTDPIRTPIRIRKKNPKIHIEPENVLDHQSSHEQKRVILNGLPCQTPRYSTELEKQNNMAIAQNRYADQQNKTEASSMSTPNYSHLTVDKETKHIHWRKDSIFNTWCWGKKGVSTQMNEIGPAIILHKK